MDHGTISFRQIVGKIFRAAAVLGRAQLRHAQQLARSKSGSGRSSSSGKPASRRTRRREERSGVMGSILVAALGVLAIALVVVPGQAAWNLVRGWLFGVFGILTYFVGPLLLYVAYLMASGYLVGKFLAKTLLLGWCAAACRWYSPALRLGLQLCAGGADAVCLGPDPVLGQAACSAAPSAQAWWRCAAALPPTL